VTYLLHVDDATPTPPLPAGGTTATLLALLQAPGTPAAEHALRVAHLAVRLARTLDIDEGAVVQIEHGALLSAVARLDLYALARRVPQLHGAAAIAVASQERIDGTGFPLGLAGERIPPGARIVAVASAYEELVSNGGLTPAEALTVLCGARAREFDPAVLGALRRQFRPEVSGLWPAA